MKVVPKEVYLYLKELYRVKKLNPHVMMNVVDGFRLHAPQRVTCTCGWVSDEFGIAMKRDILKISRDHSDKTNHTIWWAQ